MADHIPHAGSDRVDEPAPPPLPPTTAGAVHGMEPDRAGRTMDSWWRRRGGSWWKAGLLGVGLIGAVVLVHFPPDQHGFYPRCSLFTSTGLLCPGCGSIRALHALTQGNWIGALRSNALLTAGLPLLALFWAARAWTRGKYGAVPALAGRLGWLTLGLILLFGFLRNLSGPFSRWLAP